MRNATPLRPFCAAFALLFISICVCAQPTIDFGKTDSLKEPPVPFVKVDSAHGMPIPIVTVDSVSPIWPDWPVLIATGSSPYTFVWSCWEAPSSTCTYTVIIPNAPFQSDTVPHAEAHLGVQAAARAPKKIPTLPGVAGFGTTFTAINPKKE